MSARTITPIETRYRGHRFRSRMEARWAVFMDALGVAWHYELEGFKLPSGVCYMPDFFLPDMRSWLEVKNPVHEDTPGEMRKVEGLVSLTKQNAYVFNFPPALPKYDDWQKDCSGTCCFWNGDSAAWDAGYLWCECPTCLRAGIEFCGRAERIDCGCVHDGRLATYDTERIQEACWRGSAVRFEQEGGLL